jgi:subtilisin family serine protease
MPTPATRPGSRRRDRVLVVGLLSLTLAIPAGSASAAVSRPSPPLDAVQDAGVTRGWVVTLEPSAVAPEGVGVTSRRYRLDTASGRAAARGRALQVERVIERLESGRGFRAGQRFGWAMQGFTAELTSGQAARLRAHASVASVVPDTRASIAADTVPQGIARVNAADGALGGEDVDMDVAVIDTGVGPVGGPAASRELDIRGGVDCRPRRSKPYADAGSYADRHGHGTHVAGTIAARANGAGVVGVAPGARVWAVRVFDSRGVGTTASVICGVEWVTRWLADHPGRPMVVNMSLRGADDYEGPRRCDAEGRDRRDPEHQAICTAVRAGAVFAVAAGNESDDADGYIPSRYDEVITVGAMTDFDGQPGALSSRTRLSGCVPPTGAERDDTFATYSNHGAVVDVVAPGTCVRSLEPGSGTTVDTTFMSGTSMATPHVAGALARFIAARPGAATDPVGTLIAASGLDWLTATDPMIEEDPDAEPLRLVDVGALTSDTPGLRAWPRRPVVTVPGGVAQRTLRVELQRVGGFTVPVDLSFDGLPAGVTVAGGSLAAIAGIHGTVVLDIDEATAQGDHLVTLHAAGGAATGDAAFMLRVDRVPPDVTSATPRVTLRSGAAFDGSAKARIAWSASDAVSGIARTQLERRTGGSWKHLARAAASGSAGVSLGSGSSARFRVVARDRVGNHATSPIIRTRLVVRDSDGSRVTWSGAWRTRRDASASGRSVRTARGAGARATLRFTGRAVAVVAPRGPGRGRIDVTIDGVAVGSVDLTASRSEQRRIVFASGALPRGEHTITVRTRRAGTELDAILVLE